MLDFFREMMDDAPLCTMIPLAADEVPPEGWEVLDGRRVNSTEYPEFLPILRERLKDKQINAWWTKWRGGDIDSMVHELPSLPSDEVYAASFGISPGAKDLKMVIKVKHV